MILFINGAFGVGKSTVAALLKERIRGSVIFDPEEIGFMLRAMIPEEKKDAHERTGDFQDLDLWRTMTALTLGEFKKRYACDLIVPMTLKNPRYFEYLFKTAESADGKALHVCLEAPMECVHARLLTRGDAPGSWAFKQTDSCLRGFKELKPTISIDAESRSPAQIAEAIMAVLAYEPSSAVNR